MVPCLVWLLNRFLRKTSATFPQNQWKLIFWNFPLNEWMGYSPYFTCAKLIYRFDRASPGWSLVLSGPLWLFRCTYVWIRFYNSLCHFTKVDCAGPPAVRILGMRSCDFTGHINFPLSRCLARAKRIHRPKAPFNNKACYKGKAIVFEVEVAAIKHNKSSDPLNLV